MKTLLKAAPIAVAAALAAALCLPPQGRCAGLTGSNTVEPPPAYPLKKSANGRYVVDSKGAPFLVAGDAPQALMVKLTEADADLYFSNRVAHGFNAVWINLLCRPGTGGRKDGATYDGVPPFTTPDDLSAPNETYFARCDRMLSLAQNHGLLAILDPVETIDHLKVLVANGPEKCRAFGRYLGQRYRRFANLLWMSGNDFQGWRDPKNDEAALAVAKGIRDTDPDHLQTVELNYEVSGSLDDPKWEPVISISCAYTYYPTYAQVLKEYNRPNFLPVIMIESDYEFEQRATPVVLRREEYWSILAGAAGQVYGSGPIWPFADHWKSALDSTGAVQMAWVKALFEPRPWFDLVPDQQHKLVVAGYGTFDGASHEGNHYVMTSDYVTAGRTAGHRIYAFVAPAENRPLPAQRACDCALVRPEPRDVFPNQRFPFPQFRPTVFHPAGQQRRWRRRLAAGSRNQSAGNRAGFREMKVGFRQGSSESLGKGHAAAETQKTQTGFIYRVPRRGSSKSRLGPRRWRAEWERHSPEPSRSRRPAAKPGRCRGYCGRVRVVGPAERRNRGA